MKMMWLTGYDSCSEFYKLKACIIEKGSKYDVCTEKRLDVISRFIDSLTGNTVDILCTETEEGSDRCNKIVVPKRDRSVKRAKSFAFPMIYILSSIPEWIIHFSIKSVSFYYYLMHIHANICEF